MKLPAYIWDHKNEHQYMYMIYSMPHSYHDTVTRPVMMLSQCSHVGMPQGIVTRPVLVLNNDEKAGENALLTGNPVAY